METEIMSSDFNWVAALASCTMATVFEKLKLDIEADVKSRNALIPKDAPFKFSFAPSGDGFLVSVVGWNVNPCTIKFILTETAILVRNAKDDVILEATVTLNDVGNCCLKVNGQEREFWHFRKQALEELFFNFPWVKG
jgi:hypothetical protein